MFTTWTLSFRGRTLQRAVSFFTATWQPCKRFFSYALAPASRRSISSIAGFIPESAAEIRASRWAPPDGSARKPGSAAFRQHLGRQQQNLCWPRMAIEDSSCNVWYVGRFLSVGLSGSSNPMSIDKMRRWSVDVPFLYHDWTTNWCSMIHCTKASLHVWWNPTCSQVMQCCGEWTVSVFIWIRFP